MPAKAAEPTAEPKISWSNLGDGIWEAKGKLAVYRVQLLPKPVDRWVVNIDGKRELVTSDDSAGDTLKFAQRKDATAHCHEREYGRSGFATSQF